VSTLAAVVAAADSFLAPHAAPDPGAGRFESHGLSPDREFVLEAVYEGYLMHYEEPRAFVRMDPELRLLAGDALYALGLARLAELGDLEAIAELSDLISLCARAHAESRPELAGELWQASARALAEPGAPGARAAWSARA
jgi:hypothetical protein